MRILVTGGAGFIGSHITALLLEQGHEVHVLDNLSSGLRGNLWPGIQFTEMDIRDQEIDDYFAKYDFEAVIHQAGQTMVPVSVKQPYLDGDINVLGTLNLLEACRRHKVKKIAFASSAAVYGNTEQVPLTEDCPGAPTSFYGLSKWTAEHYIQMYQQFYGLEFAILRYANVYGERQGAGGEGGVVSIFAQKCCAQEKITIFGDGNQTRDFIYAGDVAAANAAVILEKVPSGIYNVSTQSETSICMLLKYFAEITGIQIQSQQAPVREGDIYRSCLSNKQLVCCSDWRPQMSLQAGLEKTYYSLITDNKN